MSYEVNYSSLDKKNPVIHHQLDDVYRAKISQLPEPGRTETVSVGIGGTETIKYLGKSNFHNIYQSFINDLAGSTASDYISKIRRALLIPVSYLSLSSLNPRPKRFYELSDVENIGRIFLGKTKNYVNSIASWINSLNANTKVSDAMKYDNLVKTYKNIIDDICKSVDNYNIEIGDLSITCSTQMTYDKNYNPTTNINKQIMSNYTYCSCGFKDFIIYCNLPIDIYVYPGYPYYEDCSNE